MADIRTYTVKSTRLEGACKIGMYIENDSTIVLDEQSASHHIFLKKFDGFENDTMWGRLKIEKNISENLIMVTHVLVRNEDYFINHDQEVKIDEYLLDESISVNQKKKFFKYANAEQIIHHNDMLLYDVQGRYCWIYIEVIGVGSGEIQTIKLIQPGDIFMKTFPQIYQEENGFFHRYISVYSSIYVDFREKIANIPDYLSIETMPKEYLTYFAQWFGMEIGQNFFEEEELRELVGQLYQLNKKKGTKNIISKCVELISKEEPELIENYYVNGNTKWDLVVKIHTPLTYIQEKQIRFLIQEFKPMGTKVNLVLSRQNSTLDMGMQLI